MYNYKVFIITDVAYIVNCVICIQAGSGCPKNRKRFFLSCNDWKLNRNDNALPSRFAVCTPTVRLIKTTMKTENKILAQQRLKPNRGCVDNSKNRLRWCEQRKKVNIPYVSWLLDNNWHWYIQYSIHEKIKHVHGLHSNKRESKYAFPKSSLRTAGTGVTSLECWHTDGSMTFQGTKTSFS